MTYLERIAHEIRSEVVGDAGEDNGPLFLIYAVLLLAKGEHVTREDVHNAWVAWVLSRGAVHESLIPYGDLPGETQAEDSPYMLAIRRVAARRRE